MSPREAHLRTAGLQLFALAKHQFKLFPVAVARPILLLLEVLGGHCRVAIASGETAVRLSTRILLYLERASESRAGPTPSPTAGLSTAAVVLFLVILVAFAVEDTSWHDFHPTTVAASLHG